MIRLLGQRNILGGGVHYGEFTDHLRRISWLGEAIEEVDLSDRQAVLEAIARSQDGDLNIWFHRHHLWPVFKGRRAVWAIFEADCLPSNHVQELNNLADVVWAPSHWARGVLMDSGVDRHRIDVVPEGVNSDKFHPFIRHALFSPDRPFSFLSVGKYEARKAYPELLAAFAAAFGNDPKVQLVLKADFFLQNEQAQRALEALVQSTGLSNIQLIWGSLSSSELLALYSACDAFVFPSRAEGWGLPLIEAIASGMPVISTAYSGHSEYLSALGDRFVSINYDLERITDPGYLQFWPELQETPARWAAPQVASIASGMCEVRSHTQSWRERALAASEVIRSTFTWRQSVDKAVQSLLARGLYAAQVRFD